MGAKSLLLLVLLLAGCGSTPKAVDPPRVKAALEAESDGAKRYGRGDYAIAARRFEEASRLYASIDDGTGTTRNRRHRARGELALGHADVALTLVNAETVDVDGLLLKAQAQLALGRPDAARQTLATVTCPAACPQAPSLSLLQARVELVAQRPAEALAHAQAALALLKDKDEAAETANAWRSIAAAQLALGDAISARNAATSALEIDRKLALPEKIARDWLLLGDIEKVGAGDTAKSAANEAAKAAYQRALAVAEAAGLKEAAELSRRALGMTTQVPTPAPTQAPK